jgi:integrase
LDGISVTTLRDLRDRALIATLTYSFARINAALKMKVEDLRPRGPGWTIRLHEKGGKHHIMPCHHALAEALHAYRRIEPGLEQSANPRRRQRGRGVTPPDPGGEWRLLGPPPDNSIGMPRPAAARMTGAPVDWPQLGRTHETVAYLARN